MFASSVDCEAIYEEITNYNGGIISEKTVTLCERLLFDGIEDGCENGDIMVVFGSPDCLAHRSPKAFQAYICGRAPKIVVSGAPKIIETAKSEAQSMWEQLRNLGVPNDAIYLEAAAEYTHENVLFSADIIRSIFPERAVKILAVTSRCHMRRALLNFEHYKDKFHEGTTVIPLPSADRYCEPLFWQTTPNGRFRTAAEIRALVTYIRKGYLPDFEF